MRKKSNKYFLVLKFNKTQKNSDLINRRINVHFIIQTNAIQAKKSEALNT